MADLLQTVPGWVGVIGWIAVLVGFLGQRKALMQARNQTSIKGHQNHVHNSIVQSVPPDGGGDSALSRWASWATIAGLFLTVLPMVKAWLAASA